MTNGRSFTTAAIENGQKQVDAQQLQSAIALATDAEHFFQLCDQMNTHNHKLH